MAQSQKHRHAADTGYARGEETRARIVLTALKLFGERGFAGASTRDIARSAGVNAPALQYYFDSKEGVYLACVEHIVEQMWAHMSDVVSQAERVLQANGDDAALIEAYCNIQSQIADFMFTSSHASDWRLFMARQQAGMGPVAGFQIMYQRVNKRMSAVTSAIVGRLLGRPAGDDETLIRAMALSGQLSVFQFFRRSALTVLSWDSVNAERLALLKRIIREQTAALFHSMIVTRDSTRRSNAARCKSTAARPRRRPAAKRKAS
ncbi:MAG: CerR family C-terminal domain-containing protein [Gammaproteobacteria bacterium]